MKVLQNIPIKDLTTMRLGGAARYVILAEQPEDVKDAYGFAEQYRLKAFPLGGGANTIGRDEGFSGVIIKNVMRGISETADGDKTILKIMGGENWDDVVAYATERGLTGIEALSKIPGQAAAAPVQNIGAYGQEVADTLTEIEVFDTYSKTFKILKKDELGFAYRQSILNATKKNRYFVISITLELRKGQMKGSFYRSLESYLAAHSITDYTPQNIRMAVSAIRAVKLPDPAEKASAGSFFKNIYLDEAETERAEQKNYPVHRGKDGNKINSGWLIEQAGLKGELLYGMRVSETAALVLINESATSYADLEKARAEITTRVYDRFGYWLEQEPVELV